MSIPGVLPGREVVRGSILGQCGEHRKLGQQVVPLRRVVLRRTRGVGISACAAPSCSSSQSLDISTVERVGLGGVEFESSALQVEREGLAFQQARSVELIRAAAYLRAVCFHAMPEGRNDEAVELHRKMKTADEFSSLRSKVAGLQQGYKRITCILALYPLSRLADSSALLKLHPSLKVTLANGEEHVVVGSLDLNQGLKALPGESALISSKSIQELNAVRERGYLSNVCVAPLMRQRGIGMALLQQTQNMSQLWGITNLYVHAVATNEAALKLYSKGGFSVVATSDSAPVKVSSIGTLTFEKKQAAVTIARRQARPPRLLLHKFI